MYPFLYLCDATVSLNIKILLQDTVESLSYSIKQLLLKEVV